MFFKNIPIRKKLIFGMNFISTMVLLITCLTFFTYEYYKFRETTIDKLSTIGKLIAANGTAALAFENKKDADEILNSLISEPNIIEACFYDNQGRVFSTYPNTLQSNKFPKNPQQKGYFITSNDIQGFENVKEGDKILGTLFIKSDNKEIYDRFQLYGLITFFVILVSLIFSYFLSNLLQKSITRPIFSLSETSKIISERGDYSIRSQKYSEDELGVLTDAFNNMISQIENQNKTLSDFNSQLEQKVKDRTAELEVVNKKLEFHTNQLIQAQQLAHIGSWYWDIPNNKIEWSEELYTIYGLKPYEFEATFEKFMEFIHPKDKDLVQGAIQEAFQNKNSFTFIHRIIRKDGAERILNAIGNVNIDINGNPISMSGTGQDITEMKKVENELKTKSEELAFSNKELGDFAYIVSHDLKAPLRAIASLANFLEEDYKDIIDNNGKQQLKLLVGRAQRMNNLIEGILEYSRIGRGDKSNYELVNLNEIINQVIDLLNPGDNIEIRIENTLPKINFDLIKIGQVFQNLIGNSIKFLDKPVGLIKIGCVQKNDFWEFYISDNGPGIDEKYFNKIFQIFQTLSPRDEKESTGIGLTIIKKIIENNGGKIWLQSKLTEGTTFYFTIPNN